LFNGQKKERSLVLTGFSHLPALACASVSLPKELKKIHNTDMAAEAELKFARKGALKNAREVFTGTARSRVN